MRPVADVAKDTFEQVMDAFPGAIYHEDREERLPLHYACMNRGPVAHYLVNELSTADEDGKNCEDRYSKLPLDYAKVNTGIAAKQAYWKTVMTTMLFKNKQYIAGDEVGEYLGIDRDEYDVFEKEGTMCLDDEDVSLHLSMKTHTRGDNLTA